MVERSYVPGGCQDAILPFYHMKSDDNNWNICTSSLSQPHDRISRISRVFEVLSRHLLWLFSQDERSSLAVIWKTVDISEQIRSLNLWAE
jgi:hypothetical protein